MKKFDFISDCRNVISQAYEDGIGDNCPLTNPEVEVIFHPPNLAYISQIEVQRDHVNKKNQGNVKQIQVAFKDANGTLILDPITGQPLQWVSNATDPIVKGYFPDMSGFIVKVLQTDNNDTVKKFRLKVKGCYSQRKCILFYFIFYLFY